MPGRTVTGPFRHRKPARRLPSQAAFVPGLGPLGQILLICLPPWLSPATLSGHLASVCILGPLPPSDLAVAFVSFREHWVHLPVWHPERYHRWHCRIFLPIPMVIFNFFWPSLNLKPNSKGGRKAGHTLIECLLHANHGTKHTVFSALSYFISFPQQPQLVEIFIPILHMRKLRFYEINWI